MTNPKPKTENHFLTHCYKFEIENNILNFYLLDKYVKNHIFGMGYGVVGFFNIFPENVEMNFFNWLEEFHIEFESSRMLNTDF